MTSNFKVKASQDLKNSLLTYLHLSLTAYMFNSLQWSGFKPRSVDLLPFTTDIRLYHTAFVWVFISLCVLRYEIQRVMKLVFAVR